MRSSQYVQFFSNVGVNFEMEAQDKFCGKFAQRKNCGVSTADRKQKMNGIPLRSVPMAAYEAVEYVNHC
jgi:hypothetical protein